MIDSHLKMCQHMCVVSLNTDVTHLIELALQLIKFVCKECTLCVHLRTQNHIRSDWNTSNYLH